MKLFPMLNLNPLVLLTAALLTTQAMADTIKEEAQVPPYTLPEVMRDATSRPITTVAEWQAWRPALLKQFGEQMYGVTPVGRPEALKFVVREEQKEARGGRATRLRIGVLF
jgi:hypothetical protein